MKRKNISLKTSMIMLSLIIFLIATSTIMSLVFFNWNKSAKTNLKIIAKDVSNSINQKTEDFLNVPKQLDEAMLLRLQINALDIQNETLCEQYFVSALKTRDSYIYSFSYGMENGDYYGARRGEDGQIEIMENNKSTNHESYYYSISENLTKKTLSQNAGAFDPRNRDWYITAKNKGKMRFSPVYKHFYKNDLCISLAAPVYDDENQLQGVIGTHLILSDMNHYLQQISKDKDGISFIIESDTGELIANSLDETNFEVTSSNQIRRYTPKELKKNAIHKIYEEYNESKEFSYETKDYEVNITEYQNMGIDWLVFVAVPKKIVMDDMYKNIKATILFTIVIFLIAILLSVFFIGRFFRPLAALLESTKAIANGELDKKVEIKRNDEFGTLANAFNDMTERINELVNHLEEMVEERTFELRNSNEMLNESKEHLSLILNSTAEAIFGIDLNGICTFCNDSCLRLLRYKDETDLIGKSLSQIIYGKKIDSMSTELSSFILDSLLEEVETHSDEECFYRSDGSKMEVEYYSYPQWKERALIGAVITFLDVSKRKASEKHIAYLNSHDALTGVYNRRYYEHTMKNMDVKENLPISVIFGDINGLKLTNDVFGHTLGDTLIKRIALVLQNACRTSDIVARIGGDEFVLLLPNTSETEAKERVGQMLEEIDKLHVGAIKCSMAMGIDTKNNAGQNLNHILEDAENRMYQEKNRNREKIDEQMIQTIVDTLHKKSTREMLHARNVSELCKKMSEALLLSEADTIRLLKLAFIHDIGKIVLDVDILRKLECSEPLTQEEKMQYEQHPIIGYRILNLFDNTVDLAECIYAHHEHWDGSGLPRKRKADETPYMARIIAIVDYYDNLGWKLKMNDEANLLDEMEQFVGLIFDPELFMVFKKVMQGQSIL